MPGMEPARRVSFATLAERARRGAAFVNAGRAWRRTNRSADDDSAQFAAWCTRSSLPDVPFCLSTCDSPQASWRQLLHTPARWLLGEAGDARLDELASGVPGLRAEIAPSLESLPATSAPVPSGYADADATLAVLYTSGPPPRQGACLSWNNFVASALAAEARLVQPCADAGLAACRCFTWAACRFWCAACCSADRSPAVALRRCRGERCAGPR